MNTIVLDAGNTTIKLARFEEGRLVERFVFSWDERNKLIDYVNGRSEIIGISSVLSDGATREIVSAIPHAILIDSTSKIPFNVNYNTYGTLGIDRLCNAAYLHKTLKTAYGVCIDVGTCIKFDVFGKSEGYLGGSISPGIRLRYQSLNDFTAKLPLLSDTTPLDLIGTTTNESIRSGVINGINAEINGFISQYSTRFEHLTFFMTGGDAMHFDIHSKNVIFADENLTSIGLHEILLHNA